tara:strand:+ start:138 stop:476 length:339 start_codon:yes stop_codon:yes gene_type:complete
MNQDNDCDILAISIIDRLCKPINEAIDKESKNNSDLQTLSTVFFMMNIRIKDSMKQELVENPNKFLNNLEKSELNQVINKNKQLHQDIQNDILHFSKCCQHFKDVFKTRQTA